MTRGIIFIILSLIFFCCQQTTDPNDFPYTGISSVTIENSTYSGSAYISSRKIENYNFRTINLILNDSTKIEILSEKFFEGLYSCDPTNGSVLFTLKYENKPFFIAEEGFIRFNKITSVQVIGEFNVVVFDASSSCYKCPGTFKKTVGWFNAIRR